MITLKDGHWYRSKAVLEKLKGLAVVDKPHLTPDGKAVMVYDRGGLSLGNSAEIKDQSGLKIAISRDPFIVPHTLIVQADHGHDLMQAAKMDGQLRIARVEFRPEDIADLEPLVEYDHLPEGRKDYKVFPKGHKLA